MQFSKNEMSTLIPPVDPTTKHEGIPQLIFKAWLYTQPGTNAEELMKRKAEQHSIEQRCKTIAHIMQNHCRASDHTRHTHLLHSTDGVEVALDIQRHNLVL